MSAPDECRNDAVIRARGSLVKAWQMIGLALVFAVSGSGEAQTAHEVAIQYLELLPGAASDDNSSDTVLEVIRPSGSASPYAVILVPGGGLSSLLYKPAGNLERGWAGRFSAAGFPVYLTHPPKRLAAAPRWTAPEVWRLWGIGESYPEPYEGSRFGRDHLDAFQSLLAVDRHPLSAAQLGALLERTGPAYVVSHSAGGRLMFNAAVLNHPNLKGTIAIETLRCPNDPEVLRSSYVSVGRSFLSIWGDRLDRGRPSMQQRYESCREAAGMIAAAGGRATTLSLPGDAGISGNSHLLMLEENAGELADLLIDWIQNDGRSD